MIIPTSLRPHWESMVFIGKSSPKWPYFRLVNYCNVPKNIGTNQQTWDMGFTKFGTVVPEVAYLCHSPAKKRKFTDIWWDVPSGKQKINGKSPSVSTVHQPFLWAIFKSEVLNYQTVPYLGHWPTMFRVPGAPGLGLRWHFIRFWEGFHGDGILEFSWLLNWYRIG